jgi:hypothetical protein
MFPRIGTALQLLAPGRYPGQYAPISFAEVHPADKPMVKFR